MLYKEMGGSRVPASHAAIDAGLNLLRMDGKGVFKWATRVLCDIDRRRARACAT